MYVIFFIPVTVFVVVLFGSSGFCGKIYLQCTLTVKMSLYLFFRPSEVFLALFVSLNDRISFRTNVSTASLSQVITFRTNNSTASLSRSVVSFTFLVIVYGQRLTGDGEYGLSGCVAVVRGSRPGEWVQQAVSLKVVRPVSGASDVPPGGH